LLIATVVLAVGLLALSGAGAAIVKLERRGDLFSRAATLGETRLDLLRERGCAAAPGSSAGTALAERWTVVKLSARTSALADSIAPAGSESGATIPGVVFRSAARC
jgi:Tfp pilus assembly protein PilV